MSRKVNDSKNRWRSKTVAFRVSHEEWEQIEILVKLSGLSKQDYIMSRLANRDVVVQGNPRVYKALRNQITEILIELQGLKQGNALTDEVVFILGFVTDIVGRMGVENDRKQ